MMGANARCALPGFEIQLFRNASKNDVMDLLLTRRSITVTLIQSMMENA
jgi:hypothetical protein